MEVDEPPVGGGFDPFQPFDIPIQGVGPGKDVRNTMGNKNQFYVDEECTIPAKMNQEDSWAVIDSFFQEKGLVFQQLGSFDLFIIYEMQRVIEQQTPVEVQPQNQYNPEEVVDTGKVYAYKFGQVTLNKPTIKNPDDSVTQLTPREARLRNLTYASDVFVNITQTIFQVGEDGNRQQVDEREIVKVPLFRIPIMVRTEYCWLKNADDKQLCEFGECPLDQGGYFVINGSEKVLIALERMANNFVYAFAKKASKYTWVCEIRSSLFEGSAGSSGFAVKMLTNMGGKSYARGQLVCTCPHLRVEVPLVVMFRALGIVADKDILERIVYDFSDIAMLAACRFSIEDAAPINTQELALDFIAKRGPTMGATRDVRIQYARELVQKELLPHVGRTPYCENRKAYFMGYMTNRLLLGALGRIVEDDRDHFGKKRMDLAGPLVSASFTSLWRKTVKDLRKNLQRIVDRGKAPNIAQVIEQASCLTNGLKYQFATGNWGIDKAGKPVRTGISQGLNRLTFMATLSHLRRMITPLARSGKLAKPRQLHNTHWGLVCPAETPEGQAVGLVKNVSLMCWITLGSKETIIDDFLEEWGVQDLSECDKHHISTYAKIFLNGNWVGVHEKPANLRSVLQYLRRRKDIDSEVSIMQDLRNLEVKITTDAGRATRPVYIVSDDAQEVLINGSHIDRLNRGQATWADLLREGLIEYLDAEEEECSMICMFIEDLVKSRAYCKTWTHAEIHPAMIFGICASIIPFPDHNMSPRNVFQSAMGKQAIGVFGTNFYARMDTFACVMCYPMKPFVGTRSMNYLRFREMPAGVNTMVFIMCYTGYNQEDSLMLGQSSVDRGFMRAVSYRCYASEEKRMGGKDIEIFERPQDQRCVGLRKGDYSKLDFDGLAEPATRVLGDDILVGKTTPLPPDMVEGMVPRFSKKDASVSMRTAEVGVVDNVMMSTNQAGFKFTKVRVRTLKIPEVGDKFASRHGQKGTLGIMYRQEDMPFTHFGCNPDIIMNPHAIPSRMTIGHLVEQLAGKVGALIGCQGDATPFTRVTVKDISGRLHDSGFQRFGNERVFNGHTGRSLTNKIFCGPVYYQRLKHMVSDKVQSRSRGPVTSLVRQPMEGRAKEGGLRFGEMERDCIISHGSAKFLKERLFDVSDAYRLHVCDTCGLFAIARLENNQYECKLCKEKAKISQVCMPYAAKLLIQELMTMNIAPRLVLEIR
jgi:DNA-directed RNA polymerase II subunit RPB2